MDAARDHGTPLIVYSRAAVEQANRAYDLSFASVPHRICYALKANGSHALLKILAGRGAGADIVSGGELLAALRAGFPAERIVFSGVGKTDAEIAQAWPAWHDANREVVGPDPDVLLPGQVLRPPRAVVS